MSEDLNTFSYTFKKGYTITCTNVSEALKDNDINNSIMDLIALAASEEQNPEKSNKIWSLLPNTIRSLYQNLTQKVKELPPDASTGDSIDMIKTIVSDLPLDGELSEHKESIGGLLEGIFTGLSQTFPKKSEENKEEQKTETPFDMNIFANMFQNMAKSLSDVQQKQSTQPK